MQPNYLEIQRLPKDPVRRMVISYMSDNTALALRETCKQMRKEVDGANDRIGFGAKTYDWYDYRRRDMNRSQFFDGDGVIDYSRKQKGQDFGISHGGITELVNREWSVTTGRSLLLDKDLRIPSAEGNEVGNFRKDNYISTLGLSDHWLKDKRGQRLLDLGAGLSIFSSEANVGYGIHVDRTDLHASKFTSTHYKYVMERYLDGMAMLGYMHDKYPNEVDRNLGTDATTILPQFQNRVASVAYHYRDSITSNPVKQMDAKNLEGLQNGHYDGVICSWVLMYLPKDEQKAAVREMVRVTKPGGEIRILPGDTQDHRHIIQKEQAKSWAESHGKKGRLKSFKEDGLMVLEVEGKKEDAPMESKDNEVVRKGGKKDDNCVIS